MNNTPTRIASGDEAAKATWDRMVATLPPIDHSRLCGDENSLDSRHGVGMRILVDQPAPVSAAQVARDAAHQSERRQRMSEPDGSRVRAAVVLIVALVGILGLLIWSMGGAA